MIVGQINTQHGAVFSSGPHNGVYYFDQPVAVNGKQIGSNYIANVKFDPKNVLQIKKGNS